MSVNGCAACINYGIKHQNGPVTIMVGGCNVMGHHKKHDNDDDGDGQYTWLTTVTNTDDNTQHRVYYMRGFFFHSDPDTLAR